MDLYYWPPVSKWGLPSFDMKSLHALTYIKLSGADVNLNPVRKSWLPKDRKTLPSLHTPNHGVIDKTEDIICYLKDKGYDLDASLDVDIESDVLPFSALVSEKLLPAVIWTMFVDDVNFKDVTFSLYARACKYPLNFTVPHHIQKTQETYVKQIKFMMYRHDDEDEKKAFTQLLSDAKSILNLLSEYLGDKDYIFGKEPSSLDALLISVLAPLLKMSFKNDKLQNHLKGCSNICQYVNRILKKCFLDTDDATITPASDIKPDVKDPDATDWKYDVLFPVTVATIAMASYAANARLLHYSN